MKMIRVIFFDIGGVYVKGGQDYPTQQVASSLGLDEKRVARHVNELIDDFSEGRMREEEFFGKLAEKLNSDASNIREAWMLEGVFEINPSVDSIVRKLKENGYTVAAVTDTDPAHLSRHKKTYTYNVFDFVANSVDAHSQKKDGNIYVQAMRTANAKPQECLMIDDIKENVESAAKEGMKAILFKNPRSLVSDLRHSGIKI